MAHELRTPAAALLASASALENPATRDAAAERGAPQARRLVDLTESLLEISRLDAGQAVLTWTEFDLVALLREVINEIAQPDEVTLIAPPELFVRLDATRTRVIVRNLVENAQVHGRPPVEVSAHLNGEHVTVQV